MNATTDEVNPAEVELISKIMMVGFILGPCFAGCLHWGLTRKQKKNHFIKIPTRVEPILDDPEVIDDHRRVNDVKGEVNGEVNSEVKYGQNVSTTSRIPEIHNGSTRPNPGRKKPNFSVISSV